MKLSTSQKETFRRLIQGKALRVPRSDAERLQEDFAKWIKATEGRRQSKLQARIRATPLPGGDMRIAMETPFWLTQEEWNLLMDAAVQTHGYEDPADP